MLAHVLDDHDRSAALGLAGVEARLALDGDYGFVSNMISASLLDLADPAHPALLAELPPSDGYPGVGQDLSGAGALALLDDSYAVATYGSLSQRRLATIDISPPTQPLIAGWLEQPAPGAYVGLRCNDGVCYVGLAGAGLWVVDVSDPEDPLELSMVPGRGPADSWGIDVADELAYLSWVRSLEGVAPGEGGVRVLDVSDPAAPREIGIYQTPGVAMDVAIGDGYAYIADGPAGVLAIRRQGGT
jgi:hypothetical protein